VNTDASEIVTPFGDLNLLYGENPFVCQPGPDNLFACQPSQENPYVCQPGQDNLYAYQPGQENTIVSQAASSNTVLGEPFVEGKPLVFFFDTTLL
jgi:hypothetical protein